jgi:glycosyltransferase involved in cell wall biosynthesis
LKSTLNIPYVVTMHGSYDCTEVSEHHRFQFLRLVDHWFYLTPRNMSKFEGVPLNSSVMSKIANGFASSVRKNPVSRADLGVDSECLVFTLASRAVPGKGWDIAIKAIEIARDIVDADLLLLICGVGELFTELSEKHQRKSFVKFLGFRNDVSDIYSLSDVAILPTRFPGESYPLTLIQALQTGTPVIASNVGEISSMISLNGASAGILVEPIADDDDFTNLVVKAIVNISNIDRRSRFAENAKRVGAKFDITTVGQFYIDKFEELLVASRVRTTKQKTVM